MKKNAFWPLAVMLCYGLILGSCKKNHETLALDHSESIPNHVALAKAFLRSQSKAETQVLNGSSASKILSKARWDVASLKQLAANETLITVPIDEIKIKSATDRLIRQLVFYTNNGHVTSANIIEIFKTGANQTDIEKLAVGNVLPLKIDGFDGKIIRYDLDYKLVLGRSYNKGSRTSAAGYRTLKPRKSAPNAQVLSAPPNEIEMLNTQCYNVYWVDYYSDGSEEWHFLYSFCDGETDPNDNPAPPDDGGGGGTGDTDPTPNACYESYEDNVNGSQTTNSLSRYGEDFSIDPNTRERYWNWKFHKGPTWQLTASLTGKISRTNDPLNPNEWKFDNLKFNNSNVTGAVFGLTVSHTVSNTSINQNPVASAITIQYTVLITAVCSSVPIYSNLPHSNSQIVHWNAQ